MKYTTMLALFMLFPLFAQSTPDTVHYVDLERYSGEWYEIARYPNKFQSDCGPTRATYTLKGRKVAVLNECRLKDNSGKMQSARGTAFVVDEQSQSKLKVSFVPFLQHFGLFAGEYWILELDPDYQYALVGDSKREFLWILSRSPKMPREELEEYKFLASQQGFDVSKLQMTPTWKK